MITKEQHIKKHTLKENTYDEECPYCNGEINNKAKMNKALEGLGIRFG